MSACTFEEKSDVTFSSAEILLHNKKNTSCINAYYYSCFQLVNHFIRNLFNISKPELYKMMQDIKGEDDGKYLDSHNLTISIFGTLMEDRELDDPRLISTINYLKKIRKEADYDEVFIKADTAQQTKLKAEYFRTKLKEYKDELI